MTELSPKSQALKNAVKTLYKGEKCAEMGWEMDKSTIIAVLQCLIDECSEVRGTGRVDKKSQVVSVKTLMELADELEKIK